MMVPVFFPMSVFRVKSSASFIILLIRGSVGLLVCAPFFAGCGGSMQSTPPPALQGQSIIFASIATQAIGSTVALTATASSGLPVSFASQTTTVCTVPGATVTLLSVGTCTIQGTQAGNTTYSAALPESQSFSVLQSLCATPAASNPTAGAGTWQQIAIDPAAYGTGSTAGWTVFGFSQEGNLLGPGDPQVFQMAPDVVPRAWARWDIYGVLASQYNFGYPTQAQAAGIVFIGGTTATVLFQDEFPNGNQFYSVVSCNAQGQPVQRRRSR